MKAKYIIIKHAGMEVPIVFSPMLTHAEVAGMREIKSAGYCKQDANGSWVATGKSESLIMGSRSQDSEILNVHLQNLCIMMTIELQP